ncbi:Protein FAM186A, partial [Dissostichus eleginoides]
MEDTDYVKQLNEPARRRYREKITAHIGYDPYQLKKSDFSRDLSDLPAVEAMDITSYLVLHTSYYTASQMKAYKSLEAFNYLVCGWVNDLGTKEALNKCRLVFARAQKALTVLSITTQTRVGRDLMAWAGVAGRAAAELKMDKRKKRPGGAEKLRLKKLKSLEVEAAKYSKLTDLFGAGVTTPAGAAAPGDERVEAYMPRQVQGKSSWSVQGESQTNSDSPKTAPPEREKAVESEEYVSPKTGSPEREKAVESEEYVSPKTGSPEREKAVESEECVSPKTGSLERETAVESEECFSPKTGSPERETAVESCETCFVSSIIHWATFGFLSLFHE